MRMEVTLQVIRSAVQLPHLRPLAVLPQVRTGHQIAFRVAEDAYIIRPFRVRHAAQTQKEIPGRLPRWRVTLAEETGTG